MVVWWEEEKKCWDWKKFLKKVRLWEWWKEIFGDVNGLKIEEFVEIMVEGNVDGEGEGEFKKKKKRWSKKVKVVV